MAARFGQLEIVKVINIDINLLKDQGGNGWNQGQGHSELRIDSIYEFNRINPELLTEPDGNGWNAYSLLHEL